MKKILFAISMVLFITVLSACGENNETAQGSEDVEQIVLRAGHNQVPDYPDGQVIHHFADKVAELSDDKIKIEVYDNATLGNENELFEGMRVGSVDMGKAITSVMSSTVESFGAFDLPYLFEDKEHMFEVLNGQAGESLLQDLEEKAGVKGLFWLDQGTRNFYTVDTPVKVPEDLNGLTIRGVQSPIMVDAINAMGGAATPMPWGEVYNSLSQGVIDGAENAPDAIWYSKQYEVVNYYSQTEHFRTPSLFMISLESWDNLSEENQDLILQAAEESEEWGKDLYEEVVDDLLKQMEEDGLEIVEDVDVEAFRGLVEPVYEKHSESVGQDLIESIRNR
ncbi:TRAP transporter substrate-binding protein [Oceanobacillus sp. CFH 90083]|uniref:TRAP transporter substrate-binding protein n=1 Tax=Oceanobacillus sp. CFH 90083 TaxID=2592336 RepID=UPI00128DEB06|nr:TRAP transporter substrate-binding protein [Oceanobacillus sp. CFH 90083]